MDPFETMKAMGELWGRGAQSFADAQRNMMGAMNTAMPGNFTGSMTGTMAMPDLASMQKAQGAFAQAWTTAEGVAATFAKGMGANGMGGQAAPDRADPIAAEVLSKVFDPRGWLSASNEVDEALNRMAQGPQLADLWNNERKFAALFTAWMALRRRNLEHNTVMLEAWTKATGVFAKAVNARAEAGQPLESARALMTLWIETANDVLLETQRSDAFLKSQRETLKAATDLRLAQQEIAEFYAEMYGAPSRSEIDDVHRSLTDLRREVRALKRAERNRSAAAGKPALAKETGHVIQKATEKEAKPAAKGAPAGSDAKPTIAPAKATETTKKAKEGAAS